MATKRKRSDPQATRYRIAKARFERWKASGMLRGAWAVSGDGEPACPLLTLRHPPMPGEKIGRIYGMAVRLRENQALIWDSRRGYMIGRWEDRNEPQRLSKPTEEPPMQLFRDAE